MKTNHRRGYVSPGCYTHNAQGWRAVAKDERNTQQRSYSRTVIRETLRTEVVDPIELLFSRMIDDYRVHVQKKEPIRYVGRSRI